MSEGPAANLWQEELPWDATSALSDVLNFAPTATPAFGMYESPDGAGQPEAQRKPVLVT